MSDIKELTNQIKKFRDDRDWMQYHTHKDMAISLCIEAAELLEHFQWERRNKKEYWDEHKEEIGDELADVAMYLFELVDSLGLDLKEIMEKKLEKNTKKYPVSKVKGSDKKYNEL